LLFLHRPAWKQSLLLIMGIGLGLAVTRNLVEMNGGSIAVQSEEAKGITFSVTLPIKGS